MDEETVDSVPGTSGHKTKQKKKIISSKEKSNNAEISDEPPKGKKTIFDLVCEAIEVSGDKRKGASVQGIKKYVKSEHGTAAANFNHLVNKALAKGIENGTLERPPHSKDATGAVGYFRLTKVEAPKRTTKAIKEPKKEEHVSDSEIIEKSTKARGRSLSDSFVAEMRGKLTSTPRLEKQSVVSKDARNLKKVLLKKKTGDKDTSDTKIMKKTEQKLMKLYSSDTEVNLEKKERVKTTSKEPSKKAKPDKLKTEKGEPASKAKAKKEITSAKEKENQTNTKLRKTKSKK